MIVFMKETNPDHRGTLQTFHDVTHCSTHRAAVKHIHSQRHFLSGEQLNQHLPGFFHRIGAFAFYYTLVQKINPCVLK